MKAVSQELNLLPEQTVGIGDAENDSRLFELCGFSATVANGLPSIKAEADCVASAERGAGVIELIDRLTRDSTGDQG